MCHVVYSPVLCNIEDPYDVVVFEDCLILNIMPIHMVQAFLNEGMKKIFFEGVTF
jgi:hypothetical protein